ncbi:MAG: biotin/lipoyl-binding protein, partial [Chloroflexi bacterium]|nr:biotin/lipoyl-binding protein [Chloroflexota bacterium]
MVKRDSITRSLLAEGSVTPEAQVPINYPTRGAVSDIKVQAGDSVHEGDELLETDPAQVNSSLDAANARL